MNQNQAINLKIGTEVRYFPVLGEKKSIPTKVTSDLFRVGGDIAVMVANVTGCVSIDNLELIDASEPINKNVTELRALLDQCCGTCTEKQRAIELLANIEQDLSN